MRRTTTTAKTFSYEVKDGEGLKEILYNFETSCKEDFKNTFYTLSRKSFLGAAECYKNPSATPEQTEQCLEKALQPLRSYDGEYRGIWKTELRALNHCIDKMRNRSDAKLSKCVNRFAKNTFNKLAQLDSKYQSALI